MGLPIENVQFDEPKPTGIPIRNVKFDAPPASPEPAPFSMEGISGDMSDTGEASQAVAAVATGLNPLVPVVSGLAGAAGLITGSGDLSGMAGDEKPAEPAAVRASRWMEAVASKLSVPLPETEAAQKFSGIASAPFEFIHKYAGETWGDLALEYTGSPMFAAAVATMGEFAAYMALGKIGKELKAKNRPFHPDAVNAKLTEEIKTFSTLVKDPEGKPLRVYHGTDKVYTDPLNEMTDPKGLYGPGHYFTENQTIANEYAETQRVIPARPGPNILLNETPELAKLSSLRGELDMLESSGAADDLYLKRVKRVKNDIAMYEEIVELREMENKPPQNVRAAYLSLENPLDMDAPVDPKLRQIYLSEKERPLPPDEGPRTHILADRFDWNAATNGTIYNHLTDYLTKPEITTKLQEAGFDGITHVGGSILGSTPHRVWMAFDAKNVHPGFQPREALGKPRPVEAATPPMPEPAPLLLGNESGQAKIISDAATGIIGISTDVKKTFAPAAVSDVADSAAGIIREKNAAAALARERFADKTEAFGQTFESLSEPTRLKFIDAVENGASTGIEAVDSAFQVMREYRESLWKKIQEMKGTDAFIENYFPHFWEDPDIAARVLTRRPLAGPASFLKERTIPTVKEGYERGLKLKTTNPVELETLKINEMLRFTMGQEIFTEFKDAGHTKFVKFGESAPEGHTKINDKIARAIQFSEAEKGFILRGEYYAPADAARILNNYLSPGLWGRSTLYNVFRGAGNFMNQVQLGLSAFHFVFTSIDAVTSTFALGVQELARGQVLSAAKNLSPHNLVTATFESFFKGSKLLKGALTGDPAFTETVDALIKGGGRLKMDAFYKNSATGNFWDAWGQAKYGTAGWNAVPALIQTLAKPIMEQWVPRVKLGIFSEMAESQVALWERQGIKPTVEMQRKAYGKMWDSVDNRMGQMVYDNLFWNRVLKDSAMASVRSLGWNLGTIREIGGGVRDIADIKVSKTGGIEVSPRTAYIIALPAVTAMYGAMYQYLKTGEGPKEFKDLYFPRTGRTTPDGRQERVSIPSYIKDVYAYAKKPLTTIGHKLHPLLAMSNQLFIDNADYYGVTIRNGDDPAVKQFSDVMRYIGTQFLPFSVRGAQMREKSGADFWEQMEAGFGINPAPKTLTQSPAEVLLDQISAKHRESGPITREEALHNQARGDITAMFRDRTTGNISAAAVEAGLQPAELAGLLRNSLKPHQVIQMLKATPREAMQVWRAASPEERKSLYSIIVRKVASNKALSVQDRMLYLKELREGR